MLASIHHFHIIHSNYVPDCKLSRARAEQVPSTTLLCTQITNTRHSWQNGTRCRDGVKVLWCHSHPVWPVFKVPFYMSLFRKLFVTCVLLLTQVQLMSGFHSKIQHTWTTVSCSWRTLVKVVMPCSAWLLVVKCSLVLGTGSFPMELEFPV